MAFDRARLHPAEYAEALAAFIRGDPEDPDLEHLGGVLLAETLIALRVVAEGFIKKG